jgi:hypothetical protein
MNGFLAKLQLAPEWRAGANQDGGIADPASPIAARRFRQAWLEASAAVPACCQPASLFPDGLRGAQATATKPAQLASVFQGRPGAGDPTSLCEPERAWGTPSPPFPLARVESLR